MATKVKTQRDYLLTEVSIDLPCNLADLDFLMRSSKGTGKIVAVYSEGGLLGVNIEQKTRVRAGDIDTVRDAARIESVDVEANGFHK